MIRLKKKMNEKQCTNWKNTNTTTIQFLLLGKWNLFDSAEFCCNNLSNIFNENILIFKEF